MYYNIFRGEDPFGVLATVDGIPLLPCASLYIIECLFNAIFTSCITAFTALTSPCWRVIWQILLNLKYVFLNHLHVQYIMLNTRDSSMSAGKVMPKKTPLLIFRSTYAVVASQRLCYSACETRSTTLSPKEKKWEEDSIWTQVKEVTIGHIIIVYKNAALWICSHFI